MTAIADRVITPGQPGFGQLRLILAVGILTFHSVTISYGSADAIPVPWMLAARFILPMFFALSGFLIAASLVRSSSLMEFAILRLFRLVPGLIVVIVISALVFGPLFGARGWQAYFTDPKLLSYFANLVGYPVYTLPGLFLHNPRSGVVNGSLWTIRIEAVCYLVLSGLSFVGLLRRRVLLAVLSLFFWSAIVMAIARGHAAWLGWFPPDLGIAFFAGVLLFLFVDRVPMHCVIGMTLLLLAVSLMMQPRWAILAGIPLAYVTIYAGTSHLLIPALPGDYSYGIYLFGYPLEQCIVYLMPGGVWWKTLALALVLALICAALLWHLVECPIMRRKHRVIGRLREWRADFVGRPVARPRATSVPVG